MPKTTIPEEFTIEDLTKDLQKIIDKNTVDSLITLLDIMLNHSELLSFHFIKSSMVVGINDFNNNLEKLLAVPRPDKNANELNIKIHLLIYLFKNLNINLTGSKITDKHVISNQTNVSVLIGLYLNPHENEQLKNEIFGYILNRQNPPENEKLLIDICGNQVLTSQDIHKLLAAIRTNKEKETIPQKIIMLKSLYLNPNADEKIKEEIATILISTDPTKPNIIYDLVFQSKVSELLKKTKNNPTPKDIQNLNEISESIAKTGISPCLFSDPSYKKIIDLMITPIVERQNTILELLNSTNNIDLSYIIEKLSTANDINEKSLLNFFRNPDLKTQNWEQLLLTIEGLSDSKKYAMLLGLFLNPNTPEIYKKHIFKHAEEFPANCLTLHGKMKLTEEIYNIEFKNKVSELLKSLKKEENKDFLRCIQGLKEIFTSMEKFKFNLIDILFEDENYKKIIDSIIQHITSVGEEKIVKLSEIMSFLDPVNVPIPNNFDDLVAKYLVYQTDESHLKMNHLKSDIIINLFKDKHVLDHHLISKIINFITVHKNINLDVFVGLYLNPNVTEEERKKILKTYLNHATEYRSQDYFPYSPKTTKAFFHQDKIYYFIEQLFKHEKEDVSSKINALIDEFTRIFPEIGGANKSVYEKFKNNIFVDMMIHIINHPDLTKNIFLKIYSYLNEKKFDWNSLFKSIVKLNEEDKKKLMEPIEATIRTPMKNLVVMNRARSEYHQQNQVKKNSIKNLPTDVLLTIYSYYYQHSDKFSLYFTTDPLKLHIVDENTKLRDFLIAELDSIASKIHAKLNPERETKPSMLDCLLLPFADRKKLKYQIPSSSDTIPIPPALSASSSTLLPATAVSPDTDFAPAPPPHHKKTAWQ